mmetsp:Transcript_360/g.822  ORF Transcript_360/g.822 Transcript_360/m.822 type:complete len:123 (-) Transcript_360:393-761(-)
MQVSIHFPVAVSSRLFPSQTLPVLSSSRLINREACAGMGGEQSDLEKAQRGRGPGEEINWPAGPTSGAQVESISGGLGGLNHESRDWPNDRPSCAMALIQTKTCSQTGAHGCTKRKGQREQR